MTTDVYGIDIQLRPGDAIPTAVRLTGELGKAEQAGARVGAAVSKGMRESGAAASSAAAAHGQLVASLGRTGVAFDGVARAIQREQQMLDRINGPTRRYADQLQTLDSLLEKNKISTSQYADQVSRLNREIERGSSRGAGGAPRAPAPPAGGIGASAGGLLAAAGIGYGVSELKSMVVSYQDLTNKMRVVTGDGESVSEVFGKVQSVARATRSDLDSTTSAYQRLRGATKEMGLSSDDLLKVTERINKAIKVSGASADEAGAGMIQLAQGISSGRLQGDELRSVLENLPYVADILAKSLGVTRGKLRELGSEGKLTSAVIIDAFNKMGSTIDADFAKTAPTLKEQWGMLKDTLTITVGKVFEAVGAFEVLGGAVGKVGTLLGGVTSIAGAVTGVMKEVKSAATSLKEETGVVGTVVGKAWDYITDPISAVKDLAGVAEKGIDALTDSLMSNSKAASAAARAYIEQVNAMRRLNIEEEKLDKVAATLEAARKAGVSNVPAFNLDFAKFSAGVALDMKQRWGIDVPAAFDEATKKALELAAGVEKIKKDRAAKDLADDVERTAKAMLGLNNVLDGQLKRWKDARDKVKEYKGAADKLLADQAHTPNAPKSRALIETLRGLRDANLELDATENRYGATIERVRKETYSHRDALQDLNGAYRTGKVTAEEYNRELHKLVDANDFVTKALLAQGDAHREWAGTMMALNALLRQGRIDAQEYSLALDKLREANPTRTGIMPRGAGYTGPHKFGGTELAVGYEQYTADQRKRDREGWTAPTLESMGIGTSIDTKWMDDLIEKESVLGGVLHETAGYADDQALALSRTVTAGNELTRAMDQWIGQGAKLEGVLVSAFQSAEDALVEFVTGGEFSFKEMVNGMLGDLTRLILKQMAAAALSRMLGGTDPVSTLNMVFEGIGLDKVPGFARGGSGIVGGSGPPDSQLFIARVSPQEHFQFTPAGTPTQTAATPAAPPNVTVYIVDEAEARMRRFMEDEGPTYFHTFDRRSGNSARRGETSGR